MQPSPISFNNSAAFYDVDGTLIKTNVVHAFSFYATRQPSLLATGKKTHGTVLSLPNGTGGAKGLAVNVTVSEDDLAASGGDIGSVTYTPGLAQRFLQLAGQQTATGTGLLATAKTGRESAVRTLQSQIDDWDRRLTSYRASLQSQFTAMETTLAALKSQSSFLSSYSSTQTSSTG